MPDPTRLSAHDEHLASWGLDAPVALKVPEGVVDPLRPTDGPLPAPPSLRAAGTMRTDATRLTDIGATPRPAGAAKDAKDARRGWLAAAKLPEGRTAKIRQFGVIGAIVAVALIAAFLVSGTLSGGDDPQARIDLNRSESGGQTEPRDSGTPEGPVPAEAATTTVPPTTVPSVTSPPRPGSNPSQSPTPAPKASTPSGTNPPGGSGSVTTPAKDHPVRYGFDEAGGVLIFDEDGKGTPALVTAPIVMSIGETLTLTGPSSAEQSGATLVTPFVEGLRPTRAAATSNTRQWVAMEKSQGTVMIVGPGVAEWAVIPVLIR